MSVCQKDGLATTRKSQLATNDSKTDSSNDIQFYSLTHTHSILSYNATTGRQLKL